jgi:chitodextrinase
MPKRLADNAALLHARTRSVLLAAAVAGLVLVLWPFVSSAGAGHLPPQPTNVRVLAATQTTVTTTWDAPSTSATVTAYKVWVWPSSQRRPPALPTATTTLTTYLATGLSCGQTYTIRLTALYGSDESDGTRALISAAPCVDNRAPSTPTGLQQIATGQTSATLSWSRSSDDVAVAGYSLSRNGAALGTTSATSYTFSGLSCGQSYSVGVRAYDVSGNYSPWASFYVATAKCGDTSAPTAPTGLVQTSKSTTGMSVGWKASSDNVGVASYDVFRNGTKLGSTGNLSYALANLNCGISYSVGVDARDAAGNVSGTTTATMTTAGCPSQPPPPPSPTPNPPTSDNQPPTTPSNLALADATPSSMDLTWSPSTDNVGVAGYGVYLDGTLTQTVTGTSYDFVGQACGTTHHLSVEAYDEADNTSPRGWVAASTSPCSASNPSPPSDTSAPSTPTNPVVLSRTPTSVTVSWAASSDNVGVTGYDGYVDGALAGKTSATTYTFTGLACNTNRTFSVDAYDAAGNKSQKVNVTGSTSACDDTQPPNSPSQLAVSGATQTGLTLDWAASTDNAGVAGYDVFVNGTKAMTVTATEATLDSLACNTTYTLGVQAFDTSGNRSSTPTVSGRTAACSSPAPPPSPPSGSGKTITVPAGGSWNSCYQQASPGDTCKVSGGSYGGQTLAWRGDLSGKCNRTNTSSLIRFDASSGVTMNGELEVDGPCVAILGGGSLNVKGEVSAFGPDPQHVPDNVLFQGMHSVHIGALAADHITFDSMDVGPATVVQSSGGSCAASEGPGDENKIIGRWVSGGSNHTPVDIVISNSAIHNQQGRNPDRGSCHYGGLFIVNVNGLLVTGTTFYGNVVYNVQIQNFTGPSPTGIVFDSNRLGCPVLWLDQGAPCDGQKSIQLNTTSTGITGTIKNNRTANGSGGTFGCMVSGCSPSGIALQNNTELADSTSAP